MAPDLNSLPTSASPTPQPQAGPATTPASPSTQSPSVHHRSSPRLNLQRRASSRLGSFSLNDSTPSSPVTADPHHHRQPSLGELHQELEEEQEAQVNRLLSLIRSQQATIAAFEANAPPPTSTSLAHSPSASHVHSRSQSQSFSQTQGPPTAFPTVPSAAVAAQRQHSTSLSRASSRRSQTSSPSLPERGRHSSRSRENMPLNVIEREQVAQIQAEALSVARENEMLKNRIRELERLVSEHHLSGST